MVAMSGEVGRLHEQTFNVGLGQALKKTTLRWRNTEVIHAELHGVLAAPHENQRADVLAMGADFLPVIIETAFDGIGADRDAKQRLIDGVKTASGKHSVLTALAVHIPLDYRRISDVEGVVERLNEGETFAYSIHQRRSETDGTLRRWPQDGFLVGDVFDLGRLIPAMAMPKERVEAVAEQVADCVNAAAERLAELPKRAQERVLKLMQQRTILRGLQTTALLWLNAMLVQQRLFAQDVSAATVGPLESFADLDQQLRVWREIVEHNWRSIFEPAVEALDLARKQGTAAPLAAFKLLAEAVRAIETAPLGMHINVGAELYPKLTDDRKQAAAFYTQPATAELLATLTIRRKDIPRESWEGNVFADHRLADLACGTGTLLRAGYRRVEALHERAGGEIGNALHEAAMERGIVGADVSPIAAHLTASSMASIGYGEAYGDTHIGWVDVGRKAGLTGALEFFQTPEVRDLFERVSGTSAGGSGSNPVLFVPDNSLTWVLMNPPYSRTRGGQSAFDIAGLSKKERTACQRKWGQLTQNEPVNRKAGMAASFLALALKKAKANGRIGFVLPLTAAFADSWAVTRQMVLRQFTEVVAIAVSGGRAIGSTALSADTGMEEMLLVATKSASDPTERRVRCVTLHDAFTRVGEAGEIARAIEVAVDRLTATKKTAPVLAGDEEIGQALLFEPGDEGETWMPVGVTSVDLSLAADSLVRGKLEKLGNLNRAINLPVDMAPLASDFAVGPTHHLIGHLADAEAIGAFELHPVARARDAIGPHRSLWAADSRQQRSIAVLPTHRAFADFDPSDSDTPQAKMWEARSRLHYARNMRWTSQATLAAMTKNAVMGGRAWTSLQHSDARVRAAFALWANSTFGMVVHWTQGQRTQTGRSTTQVGALRKIPAPRFGDLDSKALDEGLADFDALKQRSLLPACQAHADETRKDIDNAVIKLLGLPSKRSMRFADDLRLLWCSEPSVHGHNRAAVAKLGELG